MATLRDMISRVRSTHRLLSADATINDRTIAAELKSKSLYLINQKTNIRRFWNTDTIFSTIDCVEMEQVPIGTCCDYNSDIVVSKSKLKLPAIGEGNYAYLIQYIGDVEIAGMPFKFMSPLRYINSKKLGLITKDIYYWIHDRYLVCTSPFLKVVKITALFEEDIPDNLLYPDCECSSRKIKTPCFNPLDIRFHCPGILQDTVVNMTSQYLLKTYFSLPDDKTSNNDDDQSVNKT